MNERQEKNQALVRGYFSHVVDGRSEKLEDFFSPSCLVHRADLPEPLRGLDQLRHFFGVARRTVAETTTTIRQLIASEDRVAAQVHHRATFSGVLVTPLGPRDVRGKSVEWTAMAMFRIEADRIAEEWVVRDEVAIFRHLGLLDEIARLAASR